MADPKEEKKKIEAAKKDIAKEVKILAKKTQKPAEEMKELLAKQKELMKKKKLSDEEKKELKEINAKIKQALTVCKKETDTASKRLNSMLKNYVPDDKSAIPLWQKDMAPLVSRHHQQRAGVRYRERHPRGWRHLDQGQERHVHHQRQVLRTADRRK